MKNIFNTSIIRNIVNSFYTNVACRRVSTSTSTEDRSNQIKFFLVKVIFWNFLLVLRFWEAYLSFLISSTNSFACWQFNKQRKTYLRKCRQTDRCLLIQCVNTIWTRQKEYGLTLLTDIVINKLDIKY